MFIDDDIARLDVELTDEQADRIPAVWVFGPLTGQSPFEG